MSGPTPGKAKSCGAVVYRAGGDGPEFLLLHYVAGHWDLPKGHVESGETEEETARREIKEETGITELVFQPAFRETIRYVHDSPSGPVEKKVVFFLAETPGGNDEVRLSNEHVGFAWLTFEAARARLTYENARGVVEAAHRVLKTQAER